ncbi:MAG: hypothetical protein ACRD1M_09235, partial [Terriglobales bacterium]
MDGSGVWRYACADIAPSEVLMQRGLTLNLVQAVMLIPTVAVAVASRPGWASLIGLAASSLLIWRCWTLPGCCSPM